MPRQGRRALITLFILGALAVPASIGLHVLDGGWFRPGLMLFMGVVSMFAVIVVWRYLSRAYAQMPE
ncbi:hypothetical protein [Dactylosporangium sp. CA-139066]|uniref:hypothetical protein n=1 Tax=Dactylosporangium sp. CA-139066 TaxID=3239930 RepID=UPI003D93CCFB